MRIDRVSNDVAKIARKRIAEVVEGALPSTPKDEVSPRARMRGTVPASKVASSEGGTRIRGPLRDPKLAVKFLTGYEATLKLDQATGQKRMDNAKESAHSFYRMYPSLYFQDLQKDYQTLGTLAEKPAPLTWIQGDCHIANFGTVRGDKETLWGVNDYDSCQKSHPELDLNRLATSMLLTNASLDSSKVAHAILDGYRSALEGIVKNGPKPCAGVRASKAQGPVKKQLEKAEKLTQEKLLEEFANKSQTGLLRNSIMVDVQPPLREELQLELAKVLPANAQLLDIAQKLDSGGSTLGLPRYYTLVQIGDELPRIVEAKVMLPLPTSKQPSQLTDADERSILKGMDSMGSLASPLRGGFSCRGLHYLVREREAEKSSIKPEKLDSDQLMTLASEAGNALAKSHARSSEFAEQMLKWMDSNPTVESNLAGFAQRYSEQALADWKAWTQSSD